MTVQEQENDVEHESEEAQPLAGYLQQRPALLLTFLDMAERYSNPRQRDGHVPSR